LRFRETASFASSNFPSRRRNTFVRAKYGEPSRGQSKNTAGSFGSEPISRARSLVSVGNAVSTIRSVLSLRCYDAFYEMDNALFAIAARPVTTIPDVIASLEAIDALLPDTDGLKWFNWLYLTVTKAVDLNIAAAN